MPRPAAIDFRSEKSLSTDVNSLLGASFGGPDDDPATEKRVFMRNGSGGSIIGGGAGMYAEFILKKEVGFGFKLLLIS
jgi:hypothetical protein